MLKEVIDNAERGDDGRGDIGDGTVEPTTDGNQSEPRGLSGGTESQSGTTPNGSNESKGSGRETSQSSGGSQSDTEVDDGRSERDDVKSLDGNESDEERRRRIKRERDREYKRRKRDEQLRNSSDSRSDRPGGTRRNSDDGESSSLVPIKQKAPKEPKVSPTSTKTKGVRKGNKDDVNADELTAFIIAIFNLMGSLGGSHWFVTEDEANQIAEPLTRILNKMNKKKKTKVNDYMAPMLLITAIGSILVPRLMITAMEWKEKAHERKRNQARLRPNQNKAPSNSEHVAPPLSNDPQFEGSRNDRENAPQFVPTVPPEIGGLFKSQD